MLETWVRQHYQKFCVDPFAKWISRYFSPVKITLLAGISGLLIIPALAYQHLMFAVCILLFSGYLDTLDGTIARLLKQSTPTGAILDIMIDRCVELAIIIGLWLIDPLQRSLICLLMVSSILLCTNSFLIAGIFTENHSKKSFYYSPGIIERAEAFIFFILMILFPSKFHLLAYLFISLVTLTAAIRLHELFQQVD